MPGGMIQKEIESLRQRLEQLQKLSGGGPQVEPFRVQDLIGTNIPAPIPIGGTAQQGFAPQGLMFTGGLTHKPNNTGAVLHNALNFAFTLRDEINKLKKKGAQQKKQSNAGS